MTIERFVALVSPIFVGLAGWLTEWIAVHFPGTPQLDQTAVAALFGLGAASALGVVVKWLHERSKHTLKAASLDPIPDVPVTTNPPADEGDAGPKGGLLSA